MFIIYFNIILIYLMNIKNKMMIYFIIYFILYLIEYKIK